MDMLNDDEIEGIKSLGWALINSPEFLFIQ